MTGVFKVILILFLALGIGCESKSSDATTEPDTTPAPTANPVPEAFQAGEAAFNANCAVCHGIGGTGTDQGPTFLSRIYHPNHHGDQSFYRAAIQGVRAHHWHFGDMPPVEGMTHDLIVEIISYIRWLQRSAGVY